MLLNVMCFMEFRRNFQNTLIFNILERVLGFQNLSKILSKTLFKTLSKRLRFTLSEVELVVWLGVCGAGVCGLGVGWYLSKGEVNGPPTFLTKRKRRRTGF